MLALKLLFALIMPPLAVADQGCGSILVVLFLMLVSWPVASVIAAAVCVVEEIKKCPTI